jgi:hypothetical protein
VYYVGYTALMAAKENNTDIAALLVGIDIKNYEGTQPEIESALHDHTCWMLHKR